MPTHRNLWRELCSYENLELAFKKARKHKTLKRDVAEFEKNLEENLLQIRVDLLFNSYKPMPLETFIIRDPKTRKISKSDFRDRVVHHALCNIIEPIFEKSFIYDSFANRFGKGTLKAVERFDCFKRKVSKNNTRKSFVFKADIRHYFDAVDHNTLVSIIKNKIKDKRIIWLIKTILCNHRTKEKDKGMPLGNLTSQFFANVYLDELDYFVKHKLKADFYIRYVDDFVILHTNKNKLEVWKTEINSFLGESLKLELHPEKSKINELNKGVCFLGFRVFYHHRLLKKSNLQSMQRKLASLKENFENGKTDYDEVYSSIQGWLAYATHGNSHNLKKKYLKNIETLFPNNISSIELDRLIKIAKTC
ncbi:MAG: reverse transcriptase domain-containing protein [Nanoarchaeota archaeon]|nr:reverse transcriptase domain-containing protein [Nanoarchaeota archaeon]